MINHRIVDRPSFAIIGRKTYISGPDNEQFGRFWIRARAEGLFDVFARLRSGAGPQTGGVVLGVSRVEKDPANRAFDYMIAIEEPADGAHDLERYDVPATRWAVFEARGKVPDSIVRAEIYAFSEWLPASGYVHALAPEMEVYLPGSDDSENSVCEFWLPIARPQ
jgi:AraC family transcriptional regulator